MSLLDPTSCHICSDFVVTGTACHAGGAWEHQLIVSCDSAQGQPVQQQGPDISRLDPALQQQWDYAANVHLGSIDIKPYAKRKVWWTCDQCPDGHLHRWEARVDLRTDGRGCSQCSGRKVCKHNSLATKAPKVAAQWDYEANDGTPEDVVAQSNTTVGWHCDACGDKCSAPPGRRVSKNKAGCPQCGNDASAKKKVKHPTFAECQDSHSKALLAQWDHERNAPQGNFPHKIRLRSNKQIFWLCTKCPAGQEHSWTAMPFSRTGRSKPGCPYCAGQAACKCNSLQALHPAVAAEWDYAKNEGQPSDYTASSHHPAWWLNPQGDSWQQTINSRTINVQQKSARSKRVQQRLASVWPSVHHQVCYSTAHMHSADALACISYYYSSPSVMSFHGWLFWFRLQMQANCHTF